MSLYRKISILSLLTALLIFVGCGPSGDSFHLSGTIEGMQNGEIYIYNSSLNNARFDTLTVNDGKFYYVGTVDEPTPYYIVYQNALEQAVFIGPGEEITYEAVSNDLNNYKSSGSEENKLLTLFRSETRNASYSDIQTKARQFISEKPESYVSLYLFEHYFLENSSTSYDELLKVMKTLEPAQSERSYFTCLSAKVKTMKTVNIGEPFPDVPLKTKTGKTVNLWSKAESSKYTLVIYWATWIPISYELIARIRQAERDYSKSKLRIVACSIDNEFDRWNNMTRYDSLTSIEHFCDPRAFDSPAVKQTRTSTIPTYYLIDISHRVVAKGSETSELNSDMNKLLGE